MRVAFLEIAELELDEAWRHYEGERVGLGIRFCQEVAQAINRIADHPKAYQMFSARTRRCLVDKFRYGILYEHNETTTEILIVAVGHLHRRPDYWISRAP